TIAAVPSKSAVPVVPSSICWGEPPRVMAIWATCCSLRVGVRRPPMPPPPPMVPAGTPAPDRPLDAGGSEGARELPHPEERRLHDLLGTIGLVVHALGGEGVGSAAQELEHPGDVQTRGILLAEVAAAGLQVHHGLVRDEA